MLSPTFDQTFGIFANIVVQTSFRSTSFRLRNDTRLALAKMPASATLIEPAPMVCTAELCCVTPEDGMIVEGSTTACVSESDDAIRSRR